MTNATALEISTPSQASALATALMRAADFVGLTSRELSGVVGVSPSTLTRIRRGDAMLEAGTKPWELARLFVKLIVGLGTLSGTDRQAARYWFDSYNADLDAVPRERIRSVEGLTDTVDYVDGFVHRP